MFSPSRSGGHSTSTTMKHQLLKGFALTILPILLIGCSNSDVERVKTTSLTGNGMPLGELVGHSKVCKSPNWDHHQDDYKQVVVEFTCTVKVSEELIESQRQRSVSELADAVQEMQKSYPKMIERLTTNLAGQKDAAGRALQTERSRIAQIAASIQSYEAALADTGQAKMYPPSWKTNNEQQLLGLRQEHDRLVQKLNGEGAQWQQQADAAALEAQSRLESVVAWEGKYKAAVQSTEAMVVNELRARYAKTPDFQLRIVFGVPSNQKVSIRNIEWTSDKKEVPLRDGGPALFNPKEFDESLTRITKRSIFFDAAGEFRTKFPIECPSDFVGMVKHCSNKS